MHGIQSAFRIIGYLMYFSNGKKRYSRYKLSFTDEQCTFTGNTGDFVIIEIAALWCMRCSYFDFCFVRFFSYGQQIWILQKKIIKYSAIKIYLLRVDYKSFCYLF